jgi:uncharacterized membrane protein YeaQ/YmgE (transglycosylase-associated protein family)
MKCECLLPPLGLHTFSGRASHALCVLACSSSHRRAPQSAYNGMQLVNAGVMMIGALLLGLFCGIVARMLVPNDAFRKMRGPRSWLVSLVLGLAGALVGYLIFTVGLGIGDTNIFDWGGVVSALIGTLIVLPFATLVLRRASSRPS